MSGLYPGTGHDQCGVLLAVDDPAVFAGGRRYAARRAGLSELEDPRWRLDAEGLARVVLRGREAAAKFLFGCKGDAAAVASVRRALGKVFEVVRGRVDAGIVRAVVEDVKVREVYGRLNAHGFFCFPDVQRVVCLVGGGAGYVTAAEAAVEAGVYVEVWAWRGGVARGYEELAARADGLVDIFELDAFEEEFGFAIERWRAAAEVPRRSAVVFLGGAGDAAAVWPAAIEAWLGETRRVFLKFDVPGAAGAVGVVFLAVRDVAAIIESARSFVEGWGLDPQEVVWYDEFCRRRGGEDGAGPDAGAEDAESEAGDGERRVRGAEKAVQSSNSFGALAGMESGEDEDSAGEDDSADEDDSEVASDEDGGGKEDLPLPATAVRGVRGVALAAPRPLHPTSPTRVVALPGFDGAGGAVVGGSDGDGGNGWTHVPAASAVRTTKEKERREDWHGAVRCRSREFCQQRACTYKHTAEELAARDAHGGESPLRLGKVQMCHIAGHGRADQDGRPARKPQETAEQRASLASIIPPAHDAASACKYLHYGEWPLCVGCLSAPCEAKDARLSWEEWCMPFVEVTSVRGVVRWPRRQLPCNLTRPVVEENGEAHRELRREGFVR